jgi:thioredoxin
MHVACPRCTAVNRVPDERLKDDPVCGKCGQPLLPGEPVSLTEANFDAVVGKTELPVVVDFWAAWCGPCRAMHPILDQLATERDDLRVVGVDVEANQATAAKYGVLSMPTFLVFRHGRPVLQLVGSRPRRRLEEELAAVL